MATATTCMVCEGTGKIVTRRSWFKADGFGSRRCGICKGTGLSGYAAHEYAAEQKALRVARAS